MNTTIRVDARSKQAFDSVQRLLSYQRKRRMTQSQVLYEIAMYYIREAS